MKAKNWQTIALLFIFTITSVLLPFQKASATELDDNLMAYTWNGTLPTLKKTVALTFDDGPTPLEPEILKVLNDFDIKATFFWVASHANKQQAIEVIQQGSSIQNHSWDHAYFKNYSYPAILHNIERAQSKLSEVTGESPLYFRPPYGYVNPSIQKALENTQLQNMLWNVDSRDWALPHSPETILRNVIREVRPGSVILFHEKAVTVSVLPRVIRLLQSQGYTFSLLPGLGSKKPDSPPVTLQRNGTHLQTVGFLYKDTTMVPVRSFFESLGLQVIWHEDESVDLIGPNATIRFQAGQSWVKMGNEVIATMPISPCEKNGKMVAPLRVLAEAIGAQVDWENGIVSITFPAKPFQ